MTKQAVNPRGFLYRWENEQKTVVQVPCEVYSRIVGYLRPVQNWNVGKVQEWHDRVAYDRPEVQP